MIEKSKTVNKAPKDHRVAAIVAFVLSVITLIPYIGDLAMGMLHCSGEGCWGMTGIWIMCFGWVVNIVSVICGIVGLRSSKRGLAVSSLIINIMPFLIMLMIYTF